MAYEPSANISMGLTTNRWASVPFHLYTCRFAPLRVAPPAMSKTIEASSFSLIVMPPALNTGLNCCFSEPSTTLPPDDFLVTFRYLPDIGFWMV